jgi:hypothetical protein
MTLKFGDIIKFGDIDSVKSNLSKIENDLTELALKIMNTQARTDFNLGLFNLIKRTSIEIEKLNQSVIGPIEYQAFHSRNIFELKVIVTFILKSDENFKRWIGEAWQDEIDLLNGFLSLKDTDEHTNPLKERITELKTKATNGSLPLHKPKRMADMARDVGEQVEYAAFYKLYSKYVHPSSWLVNTNTNHTYLDIFSVVFISYAQLNTGQIFQQINERLFSGKIK